jgi:ATP-binding cassette subfamily B protein
MIVYSSYAMQIVISFMMLIMIFVILPRAMVSARRIREVLSTEPQIRDGGLASLPPAKGEVEFRHVSFRYPDAAEEVLHDISFSAKPGETVAFIGSTGCGKSTVVNLIPRFYDATEGEILIDGENVRDYHLGDLHARIGYVPQRAVIFMGTIASNIAFGGVGPKAAGPDEAAEIAEAARIAQAAEFVEKLAEGYDAPVSQSGTNLSGGQKQRVAIARAVYRRPEIFIFDDSFSALDYQTDRQLRQELKNHTAGATTFIVAQRIGTIRDADRIVVLDDGNVVGIGTHAELMKTCGVYREIAHSQLTAEELDNE